MKNIITFIDQLPLFQGIDRTELEKLMVCLSGKDRRYDKGQIIFMAGDIPKHLGVVLEGSVRVYREDLLGNRTILGEFGPGSLFGETFALARTKALPVSVAAAQQSHVLLMEGWRITGTCPQACSFHNRLIENMMAILAGKNLYLTEKMEVMAKRTTREKLLFYLSSQCQRSGSLSVTIPFNRQELADYLSVDRSAMSSELGKMQKEGLLTYYRSNFTLRKHIDQE